MLKISRAFASESGFGLELLRVYSITRARSQPSSMANAAPEPNAPER